MKKKLLYLLLIITCVLSTYLVYRLSGKQKLAREYGTESYEILKKLEENYIDRDNIYGVNYEELINYIKEYALKNHFTQEEIKIQEYKYNKKIKANELENIKVNYETKYESKCKEEKCLADDNTLVNVTLYNKNIIISKKGKNDKKIIITTFINGNSTSTLSGLSLMLATIQNIKYKQLNYSIDFVILTNDEEANGVKTYLKSINKNDILLSIDINNIIHGDNCYMFSGRKENNEILDLDAFYQSKQLAKENNLDIKYNPNSKDKQEQFIYPEGKLNNLEKELIKSKIQYLNLESTSWNQYINEEYQIDKTTDNIKTIEKNYPGKISNHLTTYSTLLNKILMQIRIGK